MKIENNNCKLFIVILFLIKIEIYFVNPMDLN